MKGELFSFLKTASEEKPMAESELERTPCTRNPLICRVSKSAESQINLVEQSQKF